MIDKYILKFFMEEEIFAIYVYKMFVVHDNLNSYTPHTVKNVEF